jgi:transposase
MNETLTIVSGHGDDIPVLLAQLDRIGLQPLLDEHFPTHGNWVGLSLGWVGVLWLTHMLSEGDRLLHHVAPWAQQRLHTLPECTGQPVHPLDLSADRLAMGLEALSDETRWSACEGPPNQHALRVYDLQPACVRLDSTSASGYWSVTADGLFQFGHSKDHPPNLPQVKIMLSVLDLLSMPVATDVVPGPRADDPWYIPAITRVQASLGQRGLLYVGDCKLVTLETRAFTQAGSDYYLFSLSEIQLPPEVLEGYLAPVWAGQQPLTRIAGAAGHGKRTWIVDGYEWLKPLPIDVAGEARAWTERLLVVRSCYLARAGKAALRARLAKAQAAVATLNDCGRGKKRFTELTALQAAVAVILTRYRVQGLLAVRYTERRQERRLRRYGSRPATVQAVVSGI